MMAIATVSGLVCCDKEDTIDEFVPVEYGPHGDPPVIKVSGVRKMGSSILNGFMYEDSYRIAQGMAISDGVMYRFFTTGMCKTYDVSDLDNPTEIATFKLASYSESNHANSGQFYTESDGEKYVYVSGLDGKCFVEKITPTSSELIQTITLDEIEFLKWSKRVNMICGDDGYLWIFGIDKLGDSLVFARAKRPDPKNGDVAITKMDIQDFWYEEDYRYSESISQGGKIYEGNLFFLFGTQNSDRHLDVYNVFTHEKVYSYDLNDVISEEPEDCELIDGAIIVSVAGGRGFYLLDLQP